MDRFRDIWSVPEAPDDDSASGDYLQDPELWFDRLPQPFRMIDGLLQDLISRTWDTIESRHLQRESERTRVRIPVIVAEETVNEAQNVRVVRAASTRDGILILGCVDGVRVVSTDDGRKQLAFSATTSAITSLAIEQTDDIQIIAACTESGTTCLLACIWPLSGPRLLQLSEIHTQDEQRKLIAVHIAQSITHMALITEVDDGKYQVECYHLPISSWLKELTPLLKEPSSEDGLPGTKVSSDMMFGASTQLFIIPPPKPLLPCPANSQDDALQNVFGSGEVIATGDNHLLTTAYLENRRQAFESQRRCFIKQQPPSSITEKRIPTVHFIYFKNGTKQEEPSYILIWWTTQTQLYLYSLSSKVATPRLERVIPNGSAVVATTVSNCTRYLAVGVKSGIVTIWDLKTNFCRGIKQVVNSTDTITTLMFNSRSTSIMIPILIVGTRSGLILVLKPDHTLTSLSHRISKQKEVHPLLFKGSGYHDCEILYFTQCPGLLSSIIACVYVDGSLVLWSVDKLEALCRVMLPTTGSSTTLSSTVFAVNNNCIFLTGSDGGLHYVQLSSVKYLKGYNVTIQNNVELQITRGRPGNLMENLQLRLTEFNSKMNKDNKSFQAMKESKWNDYLQHLQ